MTDLQLDPPVGDPADPDLGLDFDPDFGAVKWKAFEAQVAKIMKGFDDGVEVQQNVLVTGKHSGCSREVDVLVKGTVAGQEITIAVECKRYKKPVGIGLIDAFAGKLLDLNVESGIIFAYNGLTKPATARAEGNPVPKIAIGNALVGAEHIEVGTDWLDLLTGNGGFGDCANSNCMTGDVSWFEWKAEDGETLLAGKCYVCGTWAATCPHCGHKVEFHMNDSQCFNCYTSVRIVEDSDGGVGVIEIGDDDPPKQFLATIEDTQSPYLT